MQLLDVQPGSRDYAYDPAPSLAEQFEILAA
jgi:hypothetical protein